MNGIRLQAFGAAFSLIWGAGMFAHLDRAVSRYEKREQARAVASESRASARAGRSPANAPATPVAVPVTPSVPAVAEPVAREIMQLIDTAVAPYLHDLAELSALERFRALTPAQAASFDFARATAEAQELVVARVSQLQETGALQNLRDYLETTAGTSRASGVGKGIAAKLKTMLDEPALRNRLIGAAPELAGEFASRYIDGRSFLKRMVTSSKPEALRLKWFKEYLQEAVDVNKPVPEDFIRRALKVEALSGAKKSDLAEFLVQFQKKSRVLVLPELEAVYSSLNKAQKKLVQAFIKDKNLQKYRNTPGSPVPAEALAVDAAATAAARAPGAFTIPKFTIVGSGRCFMDSFYKWAGGKPPVPMAAAALTPSAP
jgi:hypothetical protein